MDLLQVLFEIPQEIERGLTLGTLKRVGGVIVDADSNKIRCWLQEGLPRQHDTFINPMPNEDIFNALLCGNIIQAGVTLAAAAIVVNEVKKVQKQLDEINKKLDEMMSNLEQIEYNQFINFTKHYTRGITNFRESYFDEALKNFREFRSDIEHFLLRSDPVYLLANFYLVEQSLIHIYTALEYEMLAASKIDNVNPSQIMGNYIELIEKIFNHLNIRASLVRRLPNQMERLALLTINNKLSNADVLISQMIDCLNSKKKVIECMYEDKKKLIGGNYIYLPLDEKYALGCSTTINTCSNDDDQYM